MPNPFGFELPSSLVGRFVRLDALVEEDAAQIASALLGADRSSFAWAPVPADDGDEDGQVSAEQAVAERLEQRRLGTWIPFVQRRLQPDGSVEVVGMTNFLTIERYRGPDAPPWSVEIGGTWLVPNAQRSPINTEAKLLLMTHAFDVWKVRRLQVKTDSRNERSRRAIERLGATFEGVLRNWQPGSGPGGVGAPRDTAMYSVVDSQWPEVRAQLASRLL